MLQSYTYSTGNLGNWISLYLKGALSAYPMLLFTSGNVVKNKSGVTGLRHFTRAKNNGEHGHRAADHKAKYLYFKHSRGGKKMSTDLSFLDLDEKLHGPLTKRSPVRVLTTWIVSLHHAGCAKFRKARLMPESQNTINQNHQNKGWFTRTAKA